MLRHWLPLTLFLREPGAPVDNNLVERILKKAILHRRNSLFYKTLNGARVGDLFMSLIPYLRTERSQSVRLSDRVTETRRGVEAKPLRLDAVELPRDTDRAGEAGRRVI